MTVVAGKKKKETNPMNKLKKQLYIVKALYFTAVYP